MNKIRTIISACMGGIVGVLLLIIIFSLGSTYYTRSAYETLLNEAIEKYTLAGDIETTATGIKYRTEMGESTDFEQLKLIMLLEKYCTEFGFEETEDIVLMKDLLSDMTVQNYKENGGLDVTKIITTVRKMVAIDQETINLHKEALSTMMNMIFTVTVAVIVVVLIAVVVVCIIFSKGISAPIVKIAECAKKVSEGDLSVNFPRTNIAEIKELNESFSSLQGTVNRIIDDIDMVCSRYMQGYDSPIDTQASGLQGEFMQLEDKVNELMGTVTKNTDEILNCVAAFADGNFSYDMPRFNGDHAIINDKLDACRDSLSGIIVDINSLSAAVEAGELSTRLETAGKNNDWLKVVEGLNNLTAAVDEHIEETIVALEKLADANLSFRIDADYSGQYKVIKDTINNVSETLESIIADISRVLKGLAMNDLRVTPEIEYKGDFYEIEGNIETVVKNLKALIKDMVSASEQIQAGSKSMADSSTNLALGASQQAEAVRNLVDLSTSVSVKASDNFRAASSAKEQSNRVKLEIQNGNAMLENLNESMNNIAKASETIGEINAAIDEIAFQTNILALNAAVEAARAGSHGKGFAVVADEVRNLASKSQKSAQKASEHIDATIERVEEGVKAAADTTNLLKSILAQTSDIDISIDNVLEISNQQKELSSKMQAETSTINDVVGNISSTSEETAATSEELASQIETFNQSIYLFKT